jgi:glycosyltransferase involved in cell wall biosynthesis
MSPSKQHIAIVCSRLDMPGGIERATVNLSNLLQENGHPVTLLIADCTKTSFYTIQPSVNIILADLNFGITEQGNIITRKLDLYRHIQELGKIFSEIHASIIIGTEYHFSIASKLARNKHASKILAWEHHHINWLQKNRFWNFLFKKIYPQLDQVVCQNKREAELYASLGCRTATIPYSVPETPREIADLDQKNILTIGRLIKRKGVELIPAIAEKVFQECRDWKWKIIGDGEELENLKAEIEKRKLGKQLVIAAPVSEHVSDEYRNASIYVMTSRSECLPMVLLEATSFGLPCIAFDCLTGPADIIRDKEDGYIVGPEDVDAMAMAIIELARNEEKRRQMGRMAYQNSSRYSSDRVYESWKKLFDQLS